VLEDFLKRCRGGREEEILNRENRDGMERGTGDFLQKITKETKGGGAGDFYRR